MGDARVVTVQPERLVAGGDALARLEDGRVLFVRGALPGEMVEVDLVAAKKDFARGVVTRVVEPSPDRVEPPCPHRRAGCGGCGWMHLEIEAQRAAKVDVVCESLRRIGRMDPAEVERIVHAGGAVPPTGYRTTIRVVGGPDRRPAFREEASDETVPVDSCPVAHPLLSDLLAGVHLDQGVELTLRCSVANGAITARWAAGGRGRHGSGAVEGLPGEVHVGDRAWIIERIDGVDLRVSAGSFFQSGAAAAELLVDAIGRAAPELHGAAHALDAYGGVGLFAATAMRTARHVTLVETSRSSCADAERNLRGRSATVLRREVGQSRPEGAREPVDVVVADPARSGLGKPGVAALAAAAPVPLVLVSCDPVSLARDAALLAGSGYRPERIEVLDLFPQTHHIETVTRFVRSPAEKFSG